MGRIIMGIVGIAFSFVLLKYREQVGDMLGEPAWATKVGGIYNIVILCGVIIFFWSIAYVTGTEQILFAPLFAIFPHHTAPAGLPGSEF